MNLEPLGDRVIVRPDVPDEMTPSGIIIPDMAKETPQRGTVLAIGDGELTFASNIVIGDTVVYAKFGGTTIEADDGEVLILGIRDIIARVCEPIMHRRLPAATAADVAPNHIHVDVSA